MDIKFKKETILTHKTNVLIVACIENDFKDALIKLFDSKLNGVITKSEKNKSFSGKKNQIKIITTQGMIGAEYLVLAGLGESKKLTNDILRQAYGTAAKSALQLKVKEITIVLPGNIPKGSSLEHTTQAITEGAILSLYSFDEYKTENKKDIHKINKITFISDKKLNIKEVNSGMTTGQKISEAVCFARNCVSHPGNSATPTFLANLAKDIAKKYKLKCTILDQLKIKQLKMGAFLGVSRGSDEPPKFIVLEYWGNKTKKDPFVFIGKGVTFDSGGISLKPSKGMQEMKEDMAGGAAVMGTMMATASLKLPVNLVAIIPATENLPGGSASKPGDVLTSMSGKTIEVISTDAEGRLILADSLTYAAKYKPKAVIDVATLTGACLVALGYVATGMLGNDNKVISSLKKSSEKCGEKVWELPLWDEYKELLKSDIADMKNVGNGTAGTITAAAFLEKFATDFKWAHLDIAGTAWNKSAQPYAPKGATGVGVRLLVQYLIDQS